MVRLDELLRVHPQLQVHFAATQVESALGHVRNRFAQDDLFRQWSIGTIREQGDAFPRE